MRKRKRLNDFEETIVATVCAPVYAIPAEDALAAITRNQEITDELCRRYGERLSPLLSLSDPRVTAEVFISSILSSLVPWRSEQKDLGNIERDALDMGWNPQYANGMTTYYSTAQDIQRVREALLGTSKPYPEVIRAFRRIQTWLLSHAHAKSGKNYFFELHSITQHEYQEHIDALIADLGGGARA